MFTTGHQYILFYFVLQIRVNKKHVDASVKERPQTLLIPSEEICKRVLCTFFGFVDHPDLKHKIK